MTPQVDRFYTWLDANKLKLLITRYPTTTPKWCAWLAADAGNITLSVTGMGDTAESAIGHLIPQLGKPIKMTSLKPTETEIPRFEVNAHA